MVAVLFASILGAASAAYGQTPTYQSSTVLVSPTPSADEGGQSSRNQEATARAQLLAQYIVTLPAIAGAAEDAAANSQLSARLPASVEATTNAGSFITITVTDTDAAWAQAVAQSFSSSLPTSLESIDPGAADVARTLTTLQPAFLPGAPSAPDRVTYLLVGALLGAAMGIGLAIVREALDQQVRDVDDLVLAQGLPVLGAVPDDRGRRPHALLAAPDSARADAYRAIEASLSVGFSAGDEIAAGLPSVLVVTAAIDGQGTSALAANLAVGLTRGGSSVVLVDANLDRPAVHAAFGMDVGPGLADVVGGRATLDGALREVPGTSLLVLTAGTAAASPDGLLGTASAATTLAELVRRFDVVVVDARSVLTSSDALFVSRSAAAVVLTTRIGGASRRQLRQAVHTFHRLRAPLAGIVVTGARGRTDGRPVSQRTMPPVTVTTETGADGSGASDGPGHRADD